MKILTAAQIREIDAYTIANEPIESVDLMERAAQGCFQWIKGNLGQYRRVKILVGPGNNGGDGLAIARMLAEDKKVVEVILLNSPEKLSPDALSNYNRLPKVIKVWYASDTEQLPDIQSNDLVIDALFGSGLTRPLTGLAALVVKHINQAQACVVAIDIPSGLPCNENTFDDPQNIVQATFTLTFQQPKLAFLFSENNRYTGNVVIIDINLMPEAIRMQESPYYFLDKKDIRSLIMPRSKFSHKGTFGHGLLVAGSYGKMGAAILSSRACLRTGVGLLTAHIVTRGYEIIQVATPETIVSIDPGSEYLSTIPEIEPYDAIGIGPGIGTNDFTGFMMHQLMKSVKVPMVLDADAINLLSLHPSWVDELPENSVITPHPGEFDRLTGKSNSGFERFIKQRKYSIEHKIIVVLKGAYTSITAPDGTCWFNSTGNPGMATAGSGDVLTGIILSLLAQGYRPLDAALTGVYLHGLAGDIASSKVGEEALIASDIINNLGEAFKTINT